MADTIHDPSKLSDKELLKIAAQSIEPYESCGIGIDEYEPETECAVEAYGSELVAFARAATAADRARAALAQPEPEGPTEREWDALVESAWDKHRTVGYHGERFIYEGDFDTALGFVREELARWGNHPGSPDSSGNLKTGLTGSPADGEMVELVVALRADAECVEVEHYDLCNMTADQMRRAADLLERLSPPQPVPVSERLPGLGDCDEEGRCWLRRKYQPDGPTWRLTRPASISTEALRFYYAEWLPAHALPLPGEVEG